MSGAGRLLNVSVRLPMTVRIGDDEMPRFIRSAGGLATGLEGAKSERESIWIGWPGITAEKLGEHRALVDERMTKEGLKAVHLTEAAESGFYVSVANGAIWPVLHGQLERLPLEVKHWEDYESVNQQFADCVIEEWRDGDVVWIHDYQLMLVPQMVRSRLPNALIGFFLHVPFPASEIFAVLPERKALLEGMLGADVLGLHTHKYQRNLVTSLREVLGLRPTVDSVIYNKREVKLGVFPMGVATDRFARIAARKSVQERVQQLRAEGTERMLLGIDRLDYTKGIPRRLLAFERFLERHPECHERVRLLQVAVPSREKVTEYVKLRAQVDGLVGRINGAFATASWTPVQYLYRSIPPEELVAYYRATDVMVVTPLRDGMNLVSKEFVASRDDGDGVLVLSEFTGAADELTGAICVNPYDIGATADAMHRAIAMESGERRERMADLRSRVSQSTVQRWRTDFLSALETSGNTTNAVTHARIVDSDLIERIRDAERLVLLLDYDGTLVPIQQRPEDAAPSDALHVLLRELSSLRNTEVHLVSGRRYQDLEEWFGALPLFLHAEHGLWTRSPDIGKWDPAIALDIDWMPAVRALLERFTARTPGSFIEEKSAGFAWHYRRARSGVATWQSNELRAHLVEILAESPVQVIEGKAVLEVRQAGVHKGLIVSQLFAANSTSACIVAIGDDRTDDDMFAALPPDAISIAVGGLPRRAGWRLADQPAVIGLLQMIIRARGLPSDALQHA